MTSLWEYASYASPWRLGNEDIAIREATMIGVSVRKFDPTEAKSVSLMREIEILFDRVRQRAFEAFEQGGLASGRELDDWLNAEAQLLVAVPAELVERKKSLEIDVAVPGFSSDQLKVSALPDCIIVVGKAESKKGRKQGKVHFSELSHKDLLRRFHLPNRIEPDQVHAFLENGVLKIVAKKAAGVTLKLVSVPTGKDLKEKSAAA
jgi:HSP20 family molecular chaperone IbpA